MKTLRRWCALVGLSAVLLGIGVVPQATAALAAQQPPRQDEYVSVKELPPQDQLPAAPLLITAYAFVLVVLFVYVSSVARRLKGVQQELDRLDATIKQGGKA
jgi:CcmD family protein